MLNMSVSTECMCFIIDCVCIKECAGFYGAGYGARAAGPFCPTPAHLPRLPVLTHSVRCAVQIQWKIIQGSHAMFLCATMYCAA